jgi:hypothetical protein
MNVEMLLGGKRAAMYNLEKLAMNAQHAVYVISNPDASDAEFLSLKPMASDCDVRDLATRWAGRNLKGIGVAGIIRGIPTVMLKEEPSDFLVVVRLTAAFARYAEDSREPHCVDYRVAWCERLYQLPDTRLN